MNISHFWHSLVGILYEMSPYILLGFLIAGFLHEFVKPATMSRHLAGRGWKPVVKAALFGIPLPLCSCGVLPTAVGLHRQGASKGATTSFLIATPQTGVDSIAATYSLLGLPLAIIRPIAALVGGFVGGMGVNKLVKETDCDPAQAAGGACAVETAAERRPWYRRVGASVSYGFVEMVASVGKWLVIGLIIAALITVFVPNEFLVSLSNRPILAMLAMIVIAVPMYVCATGSIPIAMSLMLKGLNPGAAFVLLMAGPAANFASMMVLGRSLGKRATAVYVGSVVVTALFFGLMIDYLFPTSWFALPAGFTGAMACHHTASWFQVACSVLLVILLVYSSWKFRGHSHANTNQQNTVDMEKTFTVNGMNCNHCRMSVEKAIAAVPGVESVTVDLAGKSATVTGDYDPAAVASAVSAAGFDLVL